MNTNSYRQKLHLEPPQGWMNDPNGLSYFDNKYHVYFQYSPFDAEGSGDRGWGHFESTNLVNWTYTGMVIRPDMPADKDGAYSGSAIVCGDSLEIFYTGNVLEDGDYDYTTAGRGANVIHVSTKDGHTMSEKEVLLTNADYPDFCCCHVRDPKVWKEDGKYHMVLGARTKTDEGCVLFYESDDLKNWRYAGHDAVPDFAYMWECPDCFRVDGHRYLSISPQGLPTYEEKFQNLYQSGYFTYDNALTDFEEWDYGFDFYAPQTFETPNGRRILVGWMGIGDSAYENLTVPLGWQHCLTVPREITRREDGVLLQNPVPEILSWAGTGSPVSEEKSVEISLPFLFYGETGAAFSLALSDFCTVTYEDGLFTLQFTDMAVSGGRTIRKCRLKECRNIRILADMSSLEIYLNGGEKVLSTRFYPKEENVTLSVKKMKGEVFPFHL